MWTIEKYKEVYARYEASGLSAKDFCENERITRSRFYYWQKKCRRLEKSSGVTILNHYPRQSVIGKAKPGFIPVSISLDSGKHTVPFSISAKTAQVQTESAQPVPGESFMEISYTNGTRIRLSGTKDLELIKTIILLSR